MGITFPNESPAYRSAREALLQREVELRRQMERVAAELRALPPGGNVPEDYLFDGIGDDGAARTVLLSELFGTGDTLMLYHYMFPRDRQDTRPGPGFGAMAALPLEDGPCPSCTALIDMWEGTLPHFENAPSDPGQDPRHLGTVEPLWTLFDLTPGGRPDADEQIAYPCCSRNT